MPLFKAYDLRGKVPDELNEDIAYKIGRAYTELYSPKNLAVGFDIRNESPAISNALIKGLTDGGSNVLNIGLCGTEEVYFATFHNQLDGGIMVTASHNPKGYNGMKLVGPDARPISSDNGLFTIRDMLEKDLSDTPEPRGTIEYSPSKTAYIDHLLSYVDIPRLKPLKIVANPGNGGAGAVMTQLQERLPFEFIYLNEVADGDFPNGVPNPLLIENQHATSQAVITAGADMGIAWDGDFDRCFFFDADGRFIEGYYLVGLLAQTLLNKNPGSDIIHDPRLIWNTIDQTKAAGGNPVQSKCGHAFIKQVMRERDAVYGGEMSAHHYFKDFAYCDSGMIPWLLIAELMSQSGKTMKALVDERMRAYPCSGEMNFRVQDSQQVIDNIYQHFCANALEIDTSDGISMMFSNWRFNLRASNTEPLLRLNVEAKQDPAVMQKQLADIVQLIDSK